MTQAREAGVNNARDLPERKVVHQRRHAKSCSHPHAQAAQQPFNCSANQGAQHHANEETHPGEKAEKTQRKQHAETVCILRQPQVTAKADLGTPGAAKQRP